MFCPKCGKQNSDGAQFCIGCGSPLKYNALPDTAGHINKKRRHPLRNAIILIMIIALAVSLTLFFILTRHDSLILGKTEEVARVSISTSGGVIEVSDEGSPVSNMKIYIPVGTYDEEKIFVVSTTEIADHTYGDIFDPVTPLITIDNGHEFADKPMYIEIPVGAADNEFLMGFFYDRNTGKLEAIPFTNISDSSITLMTFHFSDIVISKTSIERLRALSINENAAVDTKFKPGRDDWQFPNYGSALAPGGHCAGQSLTMAWYYYECCVTDRQPHLYGRFDNNGGSKTEAFWQDDSLGYRFASVVQASIDWYSREFQNYIIFSNENQARTFYAFAYAMMVTGEPQFMGIYSYNDYGEKTGGHAIIAYKVQDGRIYVADPNYPGQTDRYITLENGSFKPYSSGANASSIDEYGAVYYSEINFLAKSALVDFDVIEYYYEKLLEGTIGDAEFPGTAIRVMTKYDDNLTNITWSGEKTVTLKKEYNELLTDDMKGQALICVTPLAADLVYSLYLGNNTTPEPEPVFEVYEGNIYFQTDLKKGLNDIAFLVEKEGDGYYSYVDFIKIQIDYQPDKSDTVTTAPPKANSKKAEAAGDYYLIQIGGVGPPGSEFTSIISEIYYLYEDGTFTFRAVSKDTDPVTRSGEWSIKNNIIILDEIEYRYSGDTITMISEYPWIYQRK